MQRIKNDINKFYLARTTVYELEPIFSIEDFNKIFDIVSAYCSKISAISVSNDEEEYNHYYRKFSNLTEFYNYYSDLVNQYIRNLTLVCENENYTFQLNFNFEENTVSVVNGVLNEVNFDNLIMAIEEKLKKKTIVK